MKQDVKMHYVLNVKTAYANNAKVRRIASEIDKKYDMMVISDDHIQQIEDDIRHTVSETMKYGSNSYDITVTKQIIGNIPGSTIGGNFTVRMIMMKSKETRNIVYVSLCKVKNNDEVTVTRKEDRP